MKEVVIFQKDYKPLHVSCDDLLVVSKPTRRELILTNVFGSDERWDEGHYALDEIERYYVRNLL